MCCSDILASKSINQDASAVLTWGRFGICQYARQVTNLPSRFGGLVILTLSIFLALPNGMATAQTDAADSTESPVEDSAPPPLQVGIKVAVPFAMKKDDGSWTGLSVDLWRSLAEQLGYQYEFVELPLDELFNDLESKKLDLSIAALTVTSEREKRVDFTHAYFNTGLGIAVVPKQYQGWSAVVQRVFSKVFLQIIGGILAMLVVTGTLVYFFERKANPEQFGNGALNGIANGIWWAAVTMTTVGYGDRVPKTVGGRTMALVWMFSALLIIASFTASVTSTLTLSRLESTVRNSRDLHDVRVATVSDSTSARYLSREGIPFIRYPTIEKCMQELRDGDIEAVVYDAAMLQYLCINDYPGELDVLPGTFEKQDYAIALQEGSPLRESINQALLDQLANPKWLETVQFYLGQQGE